MDRLLENEQGHTIVEATIIYPITILLFFVLMYAALFLCQKGVLQASLEDALIYYKNTLTDTYVEADSSISFTTDGNTISATGNTYASPEKLNPYRNIFHMVAGNDMGDFKSFFLSSYSHLFFADGTDVNVTISVNDYLIYKKITATATQNVKSAINLSMAGAENSITLSASSTAVVIDGDSMIRDVDFAADIFSQTGIGEKASELVGKVTSLYDKLKEKLGIN